MSKEIEVGSLEEAQKKIAELNLDASLNKPSPEEVEQAAIELNEAKKEFEARKFDIGTPKQSDEIYDFILNFMEKHVYWTKNGWMGVLRMHEELSENKKNKKDGESFAVGYQALEFMFYAITNPGGTGLDSAKAVEKVADLYASVIEMTGEVLEKTREELKDVQWLGDKAAAMQQGFYMEREDGTKEAHDEIEANFAAPSANDLLNKE
jgi:hypothetical protein